MGDHRADRTFERRLHTAAPSSGATRTETDSLGSKEIPADAYWGINVSRALDNFAISGRPIAEYPDLIFGYACVKQAAARANAALIPHIGYAAASTLAKEALATNANIADLVVSSGLLTRDQVGDLLTPERLTRH